MPTYAAGAGSATGITRKLYTYNGIILNDTTADYITSSTTLVENYFLLDFVDIDDVAVRNVEEEKSFDDGIEDYDTFLGRRIYRVTGKIVASSQANLEQMIQDLKDKFNPRLLQINNSATDGYLSLTWSENFSSVTYTMRLSMKPMSIPSIQYDMELGGLVAPFEIVMKARNPRKENNTLKTQILNGTVGSASITNKGTFIAYPLIVLSGGFGFTIAGSTITVSNVTTGEYVSLSGTAVTALAPTASEKIIIDMAGRRIYTGSNVNNAYQYITSGSTFPWYISAAGITVGWTIPTFGTASAQVEWRDSWI